MIGWSSRNTRDRKRRARWWASLTPEEKALELRRDKVSNRVFFYTFCVIAVLLLLLAAFVSNTWLERHPMVCMSLYLAIFPGGLILGSFVSLYQKRKVR